MFVSLHLRVDNCSVVSCVSSNKRGELTDEEFLINTLVKAWQYLCDTAKWYLSATDTNLFTQQFRQTIPDSLVNKTKHVKHHCTPPFLGHSMPCLFKIEVRTKYFAKMCCKHYFLLNCLDPMISVFHYHHDCGSTTQCSI